MRNETTISVGRCIRYSQNYIS